MTSVKDLIQLVRIRQWTKNILVLVPGFFAAKISSENWITLVLGFLTFCLVSSMIYIINDWRDKEADALHPTKKNRPFPRGAITKNEAFRILIVFVGITLGLTYYLPPRFNEALIVILFINLFYSFGLKHIPYLEIILVALGFLIRIYAGGYLANVPISGWLASLITFTALLIICAKRNAEIQKGNLSARKVLKFYKPKVMKVIVILLAATSVFVYFMYCLDPKVIERIGSDKLYFTSFFILLGMARYLQQVFVKNNTGSPAELFYKDKVIFIIILCWLSSFYYFLYAN